DLRDRLSDETLARFKPEALRRQRKRRNRVREEEQVRRKVEARAATERAERIAVLRAMTVDLHGPLPAAASSVAAGGSDITGERSDAEDGVDSNGGGDGNDAGNGGGGGSALGGSPGGAGGDVWSFARVTSMGGHFPSLSTAVLATTPPAAAGVWGRNPSLWSTATPAAASAGIGELDLGPSADGGANDGGGSAGGGGCGGAWAGTRQQSQLAASPARAAAEVVSASPSGAGHDGVQHAGKKQGKKSKGVALFSNAGVRDLRR
ncbi:unnamed protein product, partial [Phaeothamnion confervicola]